MRYRLLDDEPFGGNFKNYVCYEFKTFFLFGKNERLKTFANFIFFLIELLYGYSDEHSGLQFALAL